jgi:SAM-dependent methyltransferase
VLPSIDLAGPYDLITVIDVIEHVPNPVALMKECAALLADDGYGIVVTPDVGSWTARLLGAKWWHYRPAHIGYFNTATLTLALSKAGLRPVRIERARWVLPADYLWERVMHYLPRALRVAAPSVIAGKPVSLNLFDSFLVVFQKQ